MIDYPTEVTQITIKHWIGNYVMNIVSIFRLKFSFIFVQLAVLFDVFRKKFQKINQRHLEPFTGCWIHVLLIIFYNFRKIEDL